MSAYPALNKPARNWNLLKLKLSVIAKQKLKKKNHCERETFISFRVRRYNLSLAQQKNEKKIIKRMKQISAQSHDRRRVACNTSNGRDLGNRKTHLTPRTRSFLYSNDRLVSPARVSFFFFCVSLEIFVAHAEHAPRLQVRRAFNQIARKVETQHSEAFDKRNLLRCSFTMTANQVLSKRHRNKKTTDCDAQLFSTLTNRVDL